jgi:hypothetical protein
MVEARSEHQEKHITYNDGTKRNILYLQPEENCAGFWGSVVVYCNWEHLQQLGYAEYEVYVNEHAAKSKELLDTLSLQTLR